MAYKQAGVIKCVECGESEIVGRKLCRPCYQKAWKAKKLDSYKLAGPEDVFESRIEKTDGCWLWKGTKNGYGYGIFLLPGEVAVRAHRYSYEFFVGPIPDGKIILHSCDNPPCVNPAHLRVGTRKDNSKDAASRRRYHYGTDHWNGRLSDLDVLFIRESKETQAVLSRRFGISQSHVCRIRQGKTRK